MICFESKRSRPISVDLPSSTEPAVTSRSRSVALEIADTLAVLHRGFADAVVCPRLASFGDARRGDLGNDVVELHGVGQHAAGAGHVADGAETHGCREGVLVGIALDVLGDGVEHPVPLEDLA